MNTRKVEPKEARFAGAACAVYAKHKLCYTEVKNICVYDNHILATSQGPIFAITGTPNGGRPGNARENK
jgi:hypothetical protein